MSSLRLVAFLLVAGCEGLTLPAPPGGGDDPTDTDTSTDDTDTTGPVGPLAETSYDTQSGGDGRFDVFVGVEDGMTSFQVTATTDQYVGLEGLYDPAGNQVLDWRDWIDNPRSLTNAIFGYGHVTAFDWPVREVDGPLTPGTWRMAWSVTDADYYYVPNEPVTVSIATKRDDDLAGADVGVLIAWADGVDDDPEVVAAVEAAVEHWRDVWAFYGLTLRESYTTSTLDPDLSFTYAGSATIVPVASEKDDGDLLLVVGESIDRDFSTYGVAAGIPGTIEVTPSTYVVLSWLVHAGPDGVFDDDEIALMGETMAHEMGHYEGLFHPVESTYTYWDALDDTADCTNAIGCESKLGTNLMFPYTICDADSCLTADQLTADQQAVVQRYVGAL